MRSLLGLAASTPFTQPAAEVAAGSPGKIPDWPSDGDSDYWTKLRKQFYLRDDEVYFNTATLGASPRVVVDAVAESVRGLSGTIAEWDYKPDRPNWLSGYYGEKPIRRKLGALIHREAEEM